jgi:hypothetical protein
LPSQKLFGSGGGSGSGSGVLPTSSQPATPVLLPLPKAARQNGVPAAGITAAAGKNNSGGVHVPTRLPPSPRRGEPDRKPAKERNKHKVNHCSNDSIGMDSVKRFSTSGFFSPNNCSWYIDPRLKAFLNIYRFIFAEKFDFHIADFVISGITFANSSIMHILLKHLVTNEQWYWLAT